ncbi:Condensin complex subunit 1 [Frankliniella fusca]|uniref:Condensin complex subunit 1 n=1 Tax=Frankliniella fusca TaxID=407009 RepID=A0AAE1LA38_9NEOP|nr:Condensin complex subunit 1 [Frankliniella fusca]
MDFEFSIPLSIDDLQHTESPLYVVQEVSSLRELRVKIELSSQALSKDGCFFILEHFDTLYSYLVQSKDLEIRDLLPVLHQAIRGVESMVSCFPGLIEDDMHTEQRKKMLNVAKMNMFIFCHAFRIVEDKRMGKDMLFDIKGRKKTQKSVECCEWDEGRNRALFALYNFVHLPIQKLWNPPVIEEEFVSVMSNICYKVLEDPGISSVKMKPMRESVFQILGTLVSRFQHGLSCTVKIVQLLKIYEHLCIPLAECVIALVKDYECRGFLREVVREISESESVYDSGGSKTFSMFLSEIGKNASDLVLPIMSFLLPHLDSDPYTMRNCVLEIMGEVLVQLLTSESMSEELRETRNIFLEHLRDHILDINAYVRSKSLKIWQRLAQEKSIPLSSFGVLLKDVVERLGDTSWTVVRSAVQLVKSILENNPFGAKMDEPTLREKLAHEEEILARLQEESCNLANMTRAQRWEVLVPSITLSVEKELQVAGSNKESDEKKEGEESSDMNEAEMMSTLKEIRDCIDRKEFEKAFKLVRKTEKMFPGASELREDKRLEWQVDYFIRLLKKIYLEMTEDINEEDKENVNNAKEEKKESNKKCKKRRLQTLHQSDDEMKPEEPEAVQKAAVQARVVQYLKECLIFTEEINKAICVISSLLNCGQAQVVQDTIEFLTAASIFGFDQSSSGVKQMLLLVWSSETSVKEAVALAYKSLYLDIQPDIPKGRAQAVEIVRNLCQLLTTLNQNEKAALEILVTEWVSSGAIDKACIQVMWERFSCVLKDTTPEESRSSLQLLTMVAASKVQTVQTNIDVLIKVGLGEKGQRQSVIVEDTCRALLKLVPTGRVTSDDEPLRYPSDHMMFRTLLEIITEGFTSVDDKSYGSMAEEALDVIYMLSENPDVVCEDLLRELIDQVFKKNANGESAELVSQEESLYPAEVVARLVFFIGHVAYRQWVHLDKFIFRELKRRNRLREKFAEESKHLTTKATSQKASKKAKKGKDDANESSLQNSMLSASHMLMEKQEPDDGIGGDIAADDAEAEYINSVCESEIVSPESLLGRLSSIVVAVCANPHKYSDINLQATASLSLTKLMLVSSDFCEKHLQLAFTMMEKSDVPQIRSNLVFGMGDLANRFPNLIEPWTKHFYSRLGDKSSQVRKDTILVLKHLITNEMVKVRGQISDLALCTVDPEPQISCMAISLFEELSKKGNTLYNVLPDIISRLSNPSIEVEEEKFRTIMKFLMQLIQKDRQMESLVDKLCQRFRASTHERQWCDLAYCLSLLQYSDRSLRRLLENLPCYAEKLTVPIIYDTFNDILYQAGKTQKAERLQIVEEMKSKISECLQKGLPSGDASRLDSGTAGSQDSDDSDSKPRLPSRTPVGRRNTVTRTPATVRGRGRGRGRGQGANIRRRNRRVPSSSEESESSSESDDEVFLRKPMQKKGRQ